jgi:serine phosphatase RsbU (regulator of sigma subunit)
VAALAQVEADLTAFIGEKAQMDDITLLAISRNSTSWRS